MTNKEVTVTVTEAVCHDDSWNLKDLWLPCWFYLWKRTCQKVLLIFQLCSELQELFSLHLISGLALHKILMGHLKKHALPLLLTLSPFLPTGDIRSQIPLSPILLSRSNFPCLGVLMLLKCTPIIELLRTHKLKRYSDSILGFQTSVFN